MLRTIRLDASDEHVFAPAAAPGELAVSGAFAFAAIEPEGLAGKTRQAFANGFLGLTSFGRATFVAVTEADEVELEAAREALARHFVEHYGAPGLAEARPEAEAELAFAMDLAKDALLNTIFTVWRGIGEDGGIREAFRIVEPTREPQHARVWDVVEE
ncbi:DUF6505 family protein [Lutibaculum baratangense]|nr:DUF6505 family protein [Lutibaculum baratangense]